jgi:branched-chain amino acid transport system ATP-binding protein
VREGYLETSNGSGRRVRNRMLFQMRNIHVSYDKVQALTDISLGVERESIIALIGANGAGKTTILRTISGLKRASAGEIWFEDREIEKLPAHEIVRLGIIHVAEGGNLFPYLSVLDNLKMGLYLRKGREARNDLDGVYQRFPLLKQRSSQLAETLSGGEKQILGIARALMAKPKLLLLDEPTLGLSPMMTMEIGKIISEIHRLGIPIILVEQNARLALRLAQRAYVLETGRIVLEDAAEHLSLNEHVKEAYLGG